LRATGKHDDEALGEEPPRLNSESALALSSALVSTTSRSSSIWHSNNTGIMRKALEWGIPNFLYIYTGARGFLRPVRAKKDETRALKKG
jgi:hypothetical protein